MFAGGQLLSEVCILPLMVLYKKYVQLCLPNPSKPSVKSRMQM